MSSRAHAPPTRPQHAYADRRFPTAARFPTREPSDGGGRSRDRPTHGKVRIGVERRKRFARRGGSGHGWVDGQNAHGADAKGGERLPSTSALRVATALATFGPTVSFAAANASSCAWWRDKNVTARSATALGGVTKT
eukprot:1187354-Prorocentrum_minimum.AAC.1